MHCIIKFALYFYARELNLVPKCREMNKLYCEIIKSKGKYKKKKKKLFSVEITNFIKSY